MAVAVGIDLGTTNSVIAATEAGQPTVIPNAEGSRTTPSVVAFTPQGDRLVGQLARRQAILNPKGTIYSAKRFIGRRYDEVTSELNAVSFDVVPGPDNAVRFKVQGRLYAPEEISALVLRKLAEDASKFLGEKVTEAVVTVPAYFNDAQRQATKDAGRIAGLEVLRIINEPTAAALAYGLEKRQNGLFAVYDLGGGTFDVTILVLDDGVFQVKSTGGDSALGGDDMDRALAEELFAQMEHDPKRATPVEVRVVLDAARQVKHGLTNHEVVELEPPLGIGGTLRISRARFDELIQPLLERTGKACKRALKDAELKADELDGVILVGGATRVPAVRSYVAKLFGREALADIDPDEVVALGAAIQANLLAGQGDHDEVLLLDVIPLSLGIEVGGGVVDRILPRNTTTPAAARASYTTQEDNQTGFEIHVVQGERELAADCRSLAKFTLKGIPPMAAGMARLEVTFRVDADGLLSVHAREERTGLEQQVDVKPSYGLDDDTVEQMLIDAIDHGEEDLLARRLAEARVEAHRIGTSTRKSVADDAELLVAGEREAIEAALVALDEAAKGSDPRKIQLRIDDLDAATKEFAGRRMNRAIAKAIEGQRLDAVERTVEKAKGIELAHGAPLPPPPASR